MPQASRSFLNPPKPSKTTGKINAVVEGTGTELLDGTPLSTLDTSDKITFRIKTKASPSQLHSLKSLTDVSNFKIDFATNSAKLEGALSDFTSGLSGSTLQKTSLS